MKSYLSVGVDLGGSWIRVAAADRKGEILWRHRAPSPPRARLAPYLAQVFLKNKVHRPDVLSVGSKGIWLPQERTALWKTLKSLSKTVRVLSDVELAFESALTPVEQKPGTAMGILILAGTGSIALGRTQDGRIARAGGLGPSTGDPGSGYWIARAYLNSEPGKRTREVALEAEKILESADPVARTIVSKAQSELAGLVWQVANSLQLQGAVPVSWAGGLLERPKFRNGVLGLLKMIRVPFEFRPQPPYQKPSEAAARWGTALRGWDLERLPSR